LGFKPKVRTRRGIRILLPLTLVVITDLNELRSSREKKKHKITSETPKKKSSFQVWLEPFQKRIRKEVS